MINFKYGSFISRKLSNTKSREERRTGNLNKVYLFFTLEIVLILLVLNLVYYISFGLFLIFLPILFIFFLNGPIFRFVRVLKRAKRINKEERIRERAL